MNRNNLTLIHPTTKGVSFNNLPPEAWSSILGGSTTDAGGSWVYGAGDEIVGRVVSMPFNLVRGDKVWTPGGSSKSPLPFLTDNWYHLMHCVADSLIRHGRAYILNDVKDFRYLLHSSLAPIFNPDTGELTGWDRRVGGTSRFMPPESVVYIWLPDSDVEIGPPNRYPGRVAKGPGETLAMFESLIQRYFSSGAIGTKALSMDAPPDSTTRSRIKDWWSRVSGRSNAFEMSEVLGAGASILQISDKLDEFYDAEVVRDSRREVEVAFGLPETAMNQAANLATKRQDEVGLIEKKITPLCNLIAEAINRQVYMNGYRLKFLPETLQVMQQDENAVSDSLVRYRAAGFSLTDAADILGIELTEAQRERAEAAGPYVPTPRITASGSLAEPAPDDNQSKAVDIDAVINERRALGKWAKSRYRFDTDLTGFSPQHMTESSVKQFLYGYLWTKFSHQTKTGEAAPDAVIDKYVTESSEAHDQLRDGDIGRAEHEDIHAQLVRQSIIDVFLLGYGVESIDDLPVGDREALDEMIEGELQYIGGLSEDLAAGKHPRKGLVDRVAMWANTLSRFFFEARIRGAGSQVLRWQVGATEKSCSTCSSLNGKEMTGAEWLSQPHRPRGRTLECKGYRCLCTLQPA